MHDISIVEVRKPPEGFEKVIALVSFAYTPADFDGPFVVSRSYQNKDGEWREAPVAKVAGGKRIQINDACVRNSAKNGGLWLSVQNLNVSQDVLREAMKAAAPDVERLATGGGPRRRDAGEYQDNPWAREGGAPV